MVFSVGNSFLPEQPLHKFGFYVKASFIGIFGLNRMTCPSIIAGGMRRRSIKLHSRAFLTAGFWLGLRSSDKGKSLHCPGRTGI
jgi:hypothetical protein